MIAAIAATGIWSLSVHASSRGARHLGGISANLLRLGFALPALALAAWLMGLAGWSLATAPGGTWFLLSGLVGMGLCDILVLTAYPRVGPRVTSLVVNAIAAPAAALAGWLWLGEHPGPAQAAAIAMIIAGVALVLRPREGDRFDLAGLACAIVGAVAFGVSAVMSRHGFALGLAAAQPMHWLDSTMLRVAAGLGLTLAAFALATPFHRSWRDGPGRWREAMPWLALNASLGPGLGLVCYQWALTTTPAAEVHAIIAVVPLLVLATTWLGGEERPDRLSLLGTVIAVAGVAALALLPR